MFDELSGLLDQFRQMQKLMRQMRGVKVGRSGAIRRVPGLF